MKEQLLLDILMVFFTVHIIHVYLTSFRQEMIHRTVFRHTAWAIYTLFLFLVVFNGSTYPLFTLAGNILFLTALLSAYGCHDIKTALFRSCIFHASRMAVEVVTYRFLLTALSEESFVIGNLISTIAMYTIIQLYKHWKSRGFSISLSFRYWIRLLFVPVFSMFITHYAHVTALYNKDASFFFLLTIFILLNNYFVFDVYDRISAQVLLERQNQAYEQDIHLCIRQAEDREAAYQQTRILRHDLKGRLVALNALLEAGQTEKAKKEIRKMLNENSLNGQGTFDTGNLALDALINYKYSTAAAKGIQMNCRLDVPPQIFVDGTDLCIILENLLNNAMEAVQPLPENERTVNLTAQLTKSVLIITVENPYQGEVLRDVRTTPRSSKKAEHGIGLLSVERTAQKYDGEVVIKCDNNIFRVTVMLCQRNILHGDP